MNLAKLFVIFGIVLIATLGETEGRRRWFKRKYKTIGCAGREHFDSAAKDVSEPHQQDGGATEVDVSHNTTENHRRSKKWNKFTCGNCLSRLSTPKLNDNSTDSEINTNSTKVHRRSKTNRRNRCRSVPRRWRFNKVAVVKGSNTTVVEVPPHHNSEAPNSHRPKTRKCKGRRARKGKCQTSVTHDDDDSNIDERANVDTSGENELDSDVGATIVKENIH